MVVGERADFGPGHADGADGFQIAQQRNVKRAAPTTQPCQFPRGGLCWEIDLGVGNLEYLSPADRFAPTDGRKRSWEKSLEGSVGRRVGPRVCRQVYRLIDDAEHRRRETVDDPVGAGRNRLEHRLRVRGGTVRPRALAVLRLITSSNLVGCSTGRSDGFAPRRILST